MIKKLALFAICLAATHLFLSSVSESIAAVEPANSSLKGTLKGVFKVDNLPTEGIKLALRGPDKSVREAVTNHDGTYQWAGLARGTYWLRIKLPGSTSPQETKIELPSDESISLNLFMQTRESADPTLTLTLEAP